MIKPDLRKITANKPNERRFPTGRVSVLLGLLVLLSFVIFMDSGHQQIDSLVSTMMGAVPDVYLAKATTTQFSSSGEREYNLTSPLINYYSGTDVVEVTQPQIILMRENDDVWQVNAARAKIIHSDTIELVDHVHIQKQHSPTELNTDYLRLLPKQKYAETDRPVMINTPEGQTSATGMRASFSRDKIKLLSNVRGQYAPQ